MFWPMENPEFMRNLHGRLRAKNLVWTAVISLVGSLILFLLLYVNQPAYEPQRAAKACRLFFVWLFAIQCLVLFMLGGLQAAQSITFERDHNTLDFQRLTPQGVVALMWGKLLGAPIQTWFVVACLSVFMLLTAAGGGLPFPLVFRALIVLVVFGLGMHALGLAASSFVRKSGQAGGLLLIVGIALLISGVASADTFGRSREAEINFLFAWNPIPFIGLVAEIAGESQRYVGYYDGEHMYKSITADEFLMTSFFGVRFDAIFGCIALNGFFCAIGFCLAIRRFQDELLSALSTKQAVVFFLLLQFFLFGAVEDSLSGGTTGQALATLAIANYLFLAATAMLMTPSGELLRQRLWRTRPGGHWAVLFGPMPREEDGPATRAFLILTGISIIFLLPPLFFSTAANEVAAFLLVFALLPMAFHFLVIWAHLVVEKSGLVLAACIFLAFHLLPPIFFVVGSQTKNTASLSPFAYAHYFALQRYRNAPMELVWLLPLISIACAVLLMFLTAMRIRFLLDVLAEQRRREAVKGRSQTVPSVNLPD